ncbi:unnamed protein product [Brassica rapa]|uniref:Uncharacterized protein n=1 Tax=Brassica campestris TaxID=3711 RepID=A0A8D9DJA0_BRACM|nr:unnamed protein product [Brassica rapa]
MAVYDHSENIMFRLLTQSFLCSANNDEEGQQEKIKLVHLDLGNYHVIFRFRLPIAYHGRASSIVISGTDIIRPRLGQFLPLVCFEFGFFF